MWKKTRAEINRIQELRRSNAARPLRNKKKYSRKGKNKNTIRDLAEFDKNR